MRKIIILLVLLEKAKLNTTQILISKSLIDSYISLGEFVLIKKFFKKYNTMKEVVRNKTTVRNDAILGLNVKHIDERLNHKHLLEIVVKYHSNHLKHIYELVTERKKNNAINKKLVIKVIMDCKTTLA